MTAATEPTREAWPYRMRDLCERTGLPRQVIHFYIQQGLLPEGRKTGRNMAFYGEEHLERLKFIRQLQHERFLPLKAIRALIEQRDEVFSPSQRMILSAVKTRLAGRVGATDAQTSKPVDALALLDRLGVARSDLDRMVDLGLLGMADDGHGHITIASDDVWLIEMWAQVRAAGLTDALGFSVRDLAMFEEAIQKLFEQETALVTSRLAHLPPEQIATLVERVLPLVEAFLVRLHAQKLRNFFAAL